mgnify:CR=1 FL=1
MTYTVADVAIIAAAMVVAFVLASKYFKSTEISMAAAGVVGVGFAFAHGWTQEPIRLLVEGLFNNLDLAILFICASFFVNVYSESGALNAITRKLVNRFNSKWVLMTFMGIFMLIPGALTGAGSVSVFVLGALVTAIIRFMGVSDRKTAAFVFVFAILSAAAPPINLWTMLMTAQANMPYVGFELLLLIPILIVGAFTIIYVGWGAKRQSKEEILKVLPDANEKYSGLKGWLRILLPILTLLLLFILALVMPYDLPVLGLPLMFLLSTLVAVVCNPNRTKLMGYYRLFEKTMEQVFPLVATVISVGVLQNAMAASGVKGLIGTAFVLLPFVWIYATVLLFAPLAQGSMSYGSAIVIGTPLIFMFNTAGLNTTVVCAALSLMFPIGDCLPPSRIVGRLTIEATGYQGTYTSFLKAVAAPCLLRGLLALLMLIFPNTFSFLT